MMRTLTRKWRISVRSTGRPQRRGAGRTHREYRRIDRVQALERKHPGLPMAPGKVERREFEYIRHGTCPSSSAAMWSQAKLSPRRRSDPHRSRFPRHVQGVVATDPTATRWHFVVDNLNIHLSASLVRWVADDSALDIDLGEKGKCGILHTKPAAAAFLSDSDPSHRLSLHAQALFLAQPDRDLAQYSGPQTAQRGSFVSVEDLQD